MSNPFQWGLLEIALPAQHPKLRKDLENALSGGAKTKAAAVENDENVIHFATMLRWR